MKCPFCGEIIQDDALFCTNCGKKLPESVKNPAPPTPAAQPAASSGVPAAGSGVSASSTAGPAASAGASAAPEVPAVTLSSEKDDAIAAQVKEYLDGRRLELENVLRENAELKARCEAVSKELESLKADSAGFTTQIEDLKSQLAEKENALTSLQAELDNAQRLVGRQEQEKMALSDKVAELTAAAAAAAGAAQETEAVQAAQGAQAFEPVVAEAAPSDPVAQPAVDDTGEIEIPDDEADEIDEPTQQSQVIGAYDQDTRAIETEPVPPIAPMTKTCPSCGSTMPAENKFCTSCGTKLD